VLRGVVEEKLGEWWSPEQVVLWLKRSYPDKEACNPVRFL
jgi:hypothetical protein